MAGIDEQLAVLATMSPAQLRAEWLRLHKVPAPKTTPDLLMRGIAYRLQERAHGGLPNATLREIERLARQFARTGSVSAAGDTRIKPGTRLVRDWGDTSHHVVVLEQGFLYQERRYTSLSQIAHDITGAKWSGPRFFGLTSRKAGGTADA